MRRPIDAGLCFALVAGLVAAPGLAKAKAKAKHKVKWKDVVMLESAPTSGCEFLQKIDGDASSFFVFTGKMMRSKINKKMQKVAAKAGANAYFVTDKIQVESGASYEAKAYWCDPVPTPAPEAGQSGGKASDKSDDKDDD